MFLVVPIKGQPAAGPKTANVAASLCDWACVLAAVGDDEKVQRAGSGRRVARFEVAQAGEAEEAFLQLAEAVVEWAWLCRPDSSLVATPGWPGRPSHQQLQSPVDGAIVRSPTR